MTDIHADGLHAERREVCGRLGHCLLLIQQCEAIMKWVVANSRITVNGDADHTVQFAPAAGKTMGTLVKDLFAGVLAATKRTVQAPDQPPPGSRDYVFQTTIQLGIADDDLALLESDLKDFVTLRNHLVHHFLEQHDLATPDGCRIAIASLISDLARIDHHLEQVKALASGMQQASGALHEWFRTTDGPA